MLRREGVLKHRDVFNKWILGADIEYRSHVDRPWEWVVSPAWDEKTEYRVKPKTVRKWFNVYPSYQSAWSSRKIADKMAAFVHEHRIACVPVEFTYTEGEGL